MEKVSSSSACAQSLQMEGHATRGGEEGGRVEGGDCFAKSSLGALAGRKGSLLAAVCAEKGEKCCGRERGGKRGPVEGEAGRILFLEVIWTGGEMPLHEGRYKNIQCQEKKEGRRRIERSRQVEASRNEKVVPWDLGEEDSSPRDYGLRKFFAKLAHKARGNSRGRELGGKRKGSGNLGHFIMDQDFSEGAGRVLGRRDQEAWPQSRNMSQGRGKKKKCIGEEKNVA